MNEVEWIEVARANDLETAREMLSSWLAARGIAPELLDPGDIRIDTIHTKFGDERQFWVRKDAVSRFI